MNQNKNLIKEASIEATANENEAVIAPVNEVSATSATSDISTPPEAKKVFPIAGGAVEIDLFSGKYVFNFNAIAPEKTLLESGLSYVFNPSAASSYYGLNGSLNFCEKVEKNGTVPYRYIDSMANTHYFKIMGSGVYSLENTVGYTTSIPAFIADDDTYKSFIAGGTKFTPTLWLTNGAIYKGFNADGNLVAIYNASGKSYHIYLNDSNKVTKIVTPINNEVVFAYENTGGLISKVTSEGYSATFTFNAAKLPTKIAFTTTEYISFSYNSDNTISNIETSDKLKTSFTYSSGKLTRIVNSSTVSAIPGGSSTTTTISSNTITYGTNTATITDKDGNKEYFTFNTNGQVTQYLKEVCSKVVQAARYTYTSSTNKKREVAKQSILNKTAASSFTFSNCVVYEDVLNSYNQVTQTTTSNIDVSETATAKIVAVKTYNSNHLLQKERATETITFSDGTTKQNVYVTEYTYETYQYYKNYNKPLTITTYVEGEESTKGKTVVTYGYDSVGIQNSKKVTNTLYGANGFFEYKGYDAAGLCIREFDERYKYSTDYQYLTGTPLVSKVTDEVSNVTDYTYDSLCRLSKIKGDLGSSNYSSNTFTYTNGEVTKVASDTNAYTYTYDDKRRVKEVKIANRAHETYAYTDTSTQASVTVTNAKSETFKTLITKDGLSKKTYYNDTLETESVYNADGTLATVADSVSGEQRAYTYNTLGQLKSYTSKDSSGTVKHTETYTYDKYGKVTGVTQTGSSTISYGYTYDTNAERDLNNMNINSVTITPSIDLLNRYAGKAISTIGSEVVEYLTTNSTTTNMPSAIYYYNSDGGLDSRISYTYDERGNIFIIAKDGVEQIRYTYDKLNRLIREDNKEFNQTFVFSYDRNGNITSKTGYPYTTEEIASTSTLLIDYNLDKHVSIGNKSFVYDEIGNPVFYKSIVLRWSKGNKLTYFGGVTCTYDGQGRRMGNGNTEYYYDSADRLISSSDGFEYFYDFTGIAGFKYNNATYYYRKDIQGNIVAILDTSGNVVVKYLYDAWGNHKILDNSNNTITLRTHVGNLNPFRYRGYYYDKVTGVYYLNSRYYDPVIGRFISPDNIKYADPNTLNGLNLYAYCLNNPVNYKQKPVSSSDSAIDSTISGILGGGFIPIVSVTGGGSGILNQTSKGLFGNGLLFGSGSITGLYADWNARAQVSLRKGTVKVGIAGKFSVLNVSGQIGLGPDDLNLSLKAIGDALTASSIAGIFIDPKNNTYFIGAEAKATALCGRVAGQLDIFGLQIEVGLSGELGSIGGRLGVGLRPANDGKMQFYFGSGFALGVGWDFYIRIRFDELF